MSGFIAGMGVGRRGESVRALRSSSAKRAISGALLAGGFLLSAAQAQDVAPSEKLNDIVITAQKAPSTVQTTPIAISVVDRAALERNDIHDLESLAHIAPDVSFRQDSGAPIVTVRGISSSDVSEIGDPAVAISTDGIFLNRPVALNAGLFDLDRVEVLRGPQGTLNGRNAVGGAINFITAKPVRGNSAFASLAGGNYGAINSEAWVNLDLVDAVQVRIAGITRNHDGYRATPPFGRADDDDTRAIRGTVAFHPNSRLSAFVTGEYNFVGGAGQAQLLVPLVKTATGQTVTAMPPIPSYTTFPLKGQPLRSINSYSVRGEIDYDLDFAKLTYLGGYNKLDNFNVSNNSATAFRTFNVTEHPETINQELRLASDPTKAFTWLVGGYYFQEHNALYNYVSRIGVTGLPTRSTTYDYTTRVKSYAAFATLSYEILPTLKLTGGARYSKDEKVRLGATYTANIAVNPAVYTPASGAGSGSWDKVTWHAGLDWQATPHNMLYAKVDSGYKPGGFTLINEYDPETVRSYEIGSKNRFLDNRLQLNIAAFWSDYTGQQLNQFVSVNGSSVETTVNGGKSRIYGVEPEIVFQTPEFGRVAANVQWLHARFRDFAYDGVQYAGNALPQAPNLSVGLQYQRSFETRAGELTFSIDSKLQSKQFLYFNDYGYQKQGHYSSSNANLALLTKSKKLKFELYVRNLENSVILEDTSLDAFGGAYRFAYFAPRTWGGKVSVWF